MRLFNSHSSSFSSNSSRFIIFYLSIFFALYNLQIVSCQQQLETLPTNVQNNDNNNTLQNKRKRGLKVMNVQIINDEVDKKKNNDLTEHHEQRRKLHTQNSASSSSAKGGSGSKDKDKDKSGSKDKVPGSSSMDQSNLFSENEEEALVILDDEEGKFSGKDDDDDEDYDYDYDEKEKEDEDDDEYDYDYDDKDKEDEDDDEDDDKDKEKDDDDDEQEEVDEEAGRQPPPIFGILNALLCIKDGEECNNLPTCFGKGCCSSGCCSGEYSWAGLNFACGNQNCLKSGAPCSRSQNCANCCDEYECKVDIDLCQCIDYSG